MGAGAGYDSREQTGSVDMNMIRVLTEHTANKIAAGEVVERPASVVKELVENSLDADAAEILVEVKSGGKSLVRVSDNGFGMGRDDAILCLERHSTSKIREARDLDGIRTMGFRGEAIPSIASISRFSVTTCARDETVGTFIKVDGGKTINVIDVGRSPGTTIDVKSLFFNVPARRKFLRSVEREMSEIARVLDNYALANPQVHFQLMHNDKTVLLAPATEKTGERIIAVFGRQFFNQLLSVELEGENVRVTGYIGKPELTRSSRSHQFLFVNRRPISSPGISYAVVVGYSNLIMKGRYPVFILFLDIKPGSIDVNVHPTKREIRFRNEWDVKEEVTEAVRSVLAKMDLAPEVKHPIPEMRPALEKTDFEKKLSSAEQAVFMPGKRSVEDSVTADSRVGDKASMERISAASSASGDEQKAIVERKPVERKLLELRFLGQLMKSYILTEDDEGLVLIDQHAAHERVLYERLSRIISAGGTESQSMLVPVTLELTAGEAMIMEMNLDVLQRLGFGLRQFGKNTFIVEALPDYVKLNVQEKVLCDILDQLKQDRHARPSEREQAVQYAVCRAAVKAHDTLTEKEALGLIRDLQACEIPYTCPHGRPTMIRMSLKEIEKQFKRR